MEIKIMAFIVVTFLALLPENENLFIATAAFVVSAIGLHRLYKNDQKKKENVITTLQLRVESVEKETHRCQLDQVGRYEKIDEKFKVVFAKLDNLPERVAQSVNQIRVEQDMKITKTNERIDEILKDKRR